MTLATTKDNLQRLLLDKESKVVALSGAWGTGKSHLWEDVRGASKDSAVNSALYVSLFGVSDMATLKLKIVQSAVPVAGGSNVATDLAKTAWKEGTRVLRTLHAGFAALDELALLAVPAMLRNRFIVLDDIERKHEKLSIDEVMGFIDEFTQRFGSRFLLILNSDQLADREVWDKFLEKVIDQELALVTSPEEAFDIAIKLSPSPYAAEIKSAALACELTNIRVIRKVVRSVGRILAGHGDLKPEVLQRVVPSTVLLSAIRYKGIADGPDVQFVLDFNSVSDAMRRAAGNDKADGPEDDERAKQRARWTLLMDKLGISFCDEYEALLSDYLRSGSYEIDAVAKILDRYASEANSLDTRNRIGALFERSIWHPEISEAELLDEAKALLPAAPTLDAATLTALHDCVAKLPGGAEVAAEMLGAWIAAFKARKAEVDDDDPFRTSPLHPDIVEAIKEARAARDAKLSLAEVTASIVNRQAWGRREEAAMRASTVDDYERSIREATGRGLKMFLLQSMDLYAHRAKYEAHFAPAMDNFVQACRRICADPASERLGKLVRLVFEDSKRAGDLDPPPAAEPAAAADPAP